MEFFTKYSKLAGLFGLALILSISACTRTAIVPDDTPPGQQPGDVVSPPPTSPGGSAPPPGTVHVVQPGEGLYSIGRLYGLDYKDIAAWNNISPPYVIHPGQELKLYPGGGSYSPPPRAPTSPAPMPSPGGGGGTEYYTVQPGDTLYSIGRRYGVDYRNVAAWNGLQPPYNLSVGQTLLIQPGGGGGGPGPEPFNPPVSDEPVVEYVDFTQGPDPVPVDPPTAYNPPASFAPPSSGGATYYTVQRGDTLYSIARRYGQHFRDLAQWNDISPPYNLSVGQSLLVSKADMSAPPAASPPSGGGGPQYYTVSRGDTLYSISRRFGQSVQELAALNGLHPPYTLSIGQSLKVGSGGSMGSSRFRPAAFSAQQIRQPSGPRRFYHTVQAGESIDSIAMRYRQPAHQIALWNGISPPYIIYPGQRLQIIMP